MDRAKMRLIVGGAAALFGVAGAVTLAAALAIALTPSLGPVWSVVVSAALMLGAGAGCIIYALQPDDPIEADIAAAEESAAAALSELPFDTLKALVDKHPVAALSVAMMAGYALRRDPGATVDGLRRVATSLL